LRRLGVFVCLSVCCQYAYLTHSASVLLRIPSVYITVSGHGSVLLRQCCNMQSTSVLWMKSCFQYKRPCGGVTALPQQTRCNVLHGLTPLLRGIGCVLSYRMTGAKSRRVLHSSGVGRIMRCTIAVFEFVFTNASTDFDL